jgi:formate dehydrogenase iron-sulfur subunit
MHCLEPSCVSTCLVGGITKSPEGPVIYDLDKCIGCRYCMLACSFHIPRYEWDKTVPFMKKCVMCYDRLQEGKIPACVDACPNHALHFGERETLLHQARKTIRKEPKKYIQHIWGEKEFGRTSVLYVSDVELSQLGFSKFDMTAIPHLTDPLIEKTPVIGLTVACGLIGLNWIISRRIELAQNNKNEEDQNKEDEKDDA